MKTSESLFTLEFGSKVTLGVLSAPLIDWLMTADAVVKLPAATVPLPLFPALFVAFHELVISALIAAPN